MLIIDNSKNITISYGDALEVTFDLEGLQIQKGDKICFSTKQKLTDEKACLCVDITDIDCEQNKFSVFVPSDDMAALLPGQYLYDVVLIYGNNKHTLNFPARLTVMGVAHDE